MKKKPASGPIQAAVYARISRDKVGAGMGVARQEEDCRELAERLGWEVVTVYADNDISAASGKPRPGYRAMLDAVRSGAIQGVLTWHTDRLHRRPVELEDFITLAESMALQVQTVKAGELDLATPAGRMVARMLGSAARYEVDNTRDRIRRQKEQAASDGKYRGGPRPFGYEKNGTTVRETEAKAIREATAAVLAGRSLNSIAKEWQAAGMTGTLGKAWTYNNLRDMLLRPRNAGLLAVGLPGRKKRRQGEPDWTFDVDVRGAGNWPAIVPEDEWRALVTLLTDPSRRTTDSSEVKYLGSGVYVCGREGCGARMRIGAHGGGPGSNLSRRFLYRCSAQAHLTITQDLTDEWVERFVAERLRDPRVTAELHPLDPQIGVDRERRAALVARLAAFDADYAHGVLRGDEYRKAKDMVKAEVDQVDERMTKAIQRSTSLPTFHAADPGAAFLAAPIDVKRAVLATLLTVTVLPQERRGTAWTSDRLVITAVG